MITGVSYFVELSPLLSCSCTGFLAWAEWNKSRTWIVPALCMCLCLIVWSHKQCLNVQQNLLKLLSTIAQLYMYITAELGQFTWSSEDFRFVQAKSARSAVCIRAGKCCNINCTCMLAHSEINSTCGKNWRKYSTCTLSYTFVVALSSWSCSNHIGYMTCMTANDYSLPSLGHNMLRYSVLMLLSCIIIQWGMYNTTLWISLLSI